MANGTYVPPLAVLLRSLRISRGRLDGNGRIAIDTGVLRALLAAAATGLPFSPEYYRATYPDVAASEAAGFIPDLHRHFVEFGYFEGRLGAPPEVDAAFYVATYPDVAAALLAGTIGSAKEHYMKAGAAEGRAANPAMLEQTLAWAALLREKTPA